MLSVRSLRIVDFACGISVERTHTITVFGVGTFPNKILSAETLANTLEDCNYTKGDKVVEALLMAKVLAEKIGGKAILELI